MTVKLLIDGDVIAYRAGFATEKAKYLVTTQGYEPLGATDDAKSAKHNSGDGANFVWSRKEVEPEDKALMIVDVMIREMLARFPGLSGFCVYLSGVGNYRHGIATRASYKGNRDGAAKPVHHKAIVEHLKTAWRAEVSKGEEADDLIGIAATEAPGSIVASIDKDLLQIPGRHFNFVTKEELTISPKEAVINFYAQALSGDPVDNVPGVKGIGPVKARKALEGCTSPLACWQRTVDVYVDTYGTDDGERFALEAAKLVFVRRQVGQEWSPPTK